jgi:uncharacterized protein YpiB (UPF0302 family)
MSGPTLNQLVRDQILTEAPVYEQKSHKSLQDYFINDTLHAMSNVELLERISDALIELQKPHDVRKWL